MCLPGVLMYSQLRVRMLQYMPFSPFNFFSSAGLQCLDLETPAAHRLLRRSHHQKPGESTKYLRTWMLLAVETTFVPRSARSAQAGTVNRG
jgi:hypothetical protein